MHGKAEESTILCLWRDSGGARRECVCVCVQQGVGGGLHVQVSCVDVKHEFLSHMAVCGCSIPTALNGDIRQLHKIN